MHRWICLTVPFAMIASACGGNSGGSGIDGGNADAHLPVIAVTARQWAYTPNTITLHKGVAVLFELTSEDVHHGFNIPELGVRADIVPGTTTHLRVVADKTGTFGFHCDYFCGSGHEGMEGQLVVE